MDFILFVGLLILFIYCLKLADRVRECELHLKYLKKALLSERQQTIQEQLPDAAPIPPKPPEISEALKIEEIPPSIATCEPPVKAIETKIETKEAKPILPPKQSMLFGILKENWMGVFGSFALVIGAVFFGLTSKIMQLPEARVGILILFSLLFLGASQKIKGLEKWSLLCGWLRSIAGAVILFATLGAGGIEGLKFIQSPFYALAFLSIGIAVNLLLACTTAVQAVASLHVILSIIAFCIVPQTMILLPLGALVATIGLITAYRSKWDLHLLLIVIAFACLNTVWTYSLAQSPSMHYLAIACSVVVGMIGGAIHYSKKYQSPHFEALPLVAHISNWLLLIWNLSLHAQFFKGTPFVLAAIAMGGFFLANHAKKEGIRWLYHTDTFLSQLLALAAIASLSILAINPLDLCILLLLETILFNRICIMQKEEFLLRVGYGMQSVICLMTLSMIPIAMGKVPGGDKFPIYLRMGLLTAICWGFHLVGTAKKWTIDDLRFFVGGEKDLAKPYSMTAIFGTLFFLCIYLFGFQLLTIQSTILLVAAALGYWRKYNEDQSWNLSFITSLVFIHFLNWGMMLLMLLDLKSPSEIFSRVDFAGLALLDILLIFGNFLQFKLWNKNISKLLVYALSLQIACCTYVYTREISQFLPSIFFLVYSLIALETSRYIPKRLSFSEDLKQGIAESFTRVGLALLLGFFIRFVTVNLRVDLIGNAINHRWFTEVFALLTFFYWIAFFPEKTSGKSTRTAGRLLIDASLGLMTLCMLKETPQGCTSIVWVAASIGLLIGTIDYHLPKRLAVYSWIYFIASIAQVVLFKSPLSMPNLPLDERFQFFGWLAIILQFCYAFVVCRKQSGIERIADAHSTDISGAFIRSIYGQWYLTVLFPVFLGIAFLLAFDFEKAILTVLWVGLTFIYLCVGLLIKSKRSIQIAMFALLFCSLRLIIFDLVQTDLAIRALVFIGVGALMLGMSVLYKKFKHRIEAHEGI